MAHEVEYINGRPLAVMNRTPAWWMVGDDLGKVWRDEAPLTLEVAMKEAGLTDWNVRTLPVHGIDTAEGYAGDVIDGPAWAMTVRTNQTDPYAPAEPLGMVGADYVPVQNEEAFAGAEALIGEGLVVESAASLKGGRQPFVLFRTPDTIVVGGQDHVQPYIAAMTSHDGSLALTYQLTNVRIVCANTQAWALSRNEPRYTVRHTGSGIEGRIAEAREALGMAYKVNQQWADEMDRWVATDVTRREFDKIVMGLFPEPKEEERTDRKMANLAARREGFRELHDTSLTTEGIRDTAYGVLQAGLEWDEWMVGTSTGAARGERSILRSADTRDRIVSTIRTRVPALTG